jgi:hypothetical protein
MELEEGGLMISEMCQPDSENGSEAEDSTTEPGSDAGGSRESLI